MNFSDRATQIHTAGGIGVVVAAVAFWLIVIQPQVERRAEAATTQIELDATERRADQTSLEISNLGRSIRSRVKALEESDRTLAEVDDLNSKIAGLLEIAAAHAVEISVIEPGQAEASEMFFHVPIRLEGTGQFQDCVDLIAMLHERHPDVKIIQLAMNAGTSQNASPQIKFDVVWFAALASESAS